MKIFKILFSLTVEELLVINMLERKVQREIQKDKEEISSLLNKCFAMKALFGKSMGKWNLKNELYNINILQRILRSKLRHFLNTQTNNGINSLCLTNPLFQ